jgi:electron transport complex protein RnfC
VLKTFTRGGIHPPEEKLSAHTSIQTLPLPATAIIPVSQHLGAPAKIIVSKGDVVKTGQVIAQGDGFVSSSVHASVSGKVLKIEDVTEVSGYRKPAVFIEVSGDEWLDSIIRDESHRGRDTVQNSRIRDCGFGRRYISYPGKNDNSPR